MPRQVRAAAVRATQAAPAERGRSDKYFSKVIGKALDIIAILRSSAQPLLAQRADASARAGEELGVPHPAHARSVRLSRARRRRPLHRRGGFAGLGAGPAADRARRCGIARPQGAEPRVLRDGQPGDALRQPDRSDRHAGKPAPDSHGQHRRPHRPARTPARSGRRSPRFSRKTFAIGSSGATASTASPSTRSPTRSSSNANSSSCGRAATAPTRKRASWRAAASARRFSTRPAMPSPPSACRPRRCGCATSGFRSGSSPRCGAPPAASRGRWVARADFEQEIRRLGELSSYMGSKSRQVSPSWCEAPSLGVGSWRLGVDRFLQGQCLNRS